MNIGSWSVEEKKTLLLNLRKHGAHNLQVIQTKLPHRSVAEIRYICDYFSRKAQTKWERFEASDEQSKDPSIKQWLNIFKRIRNAHKGLVSDIIPRLLKYIALYERRIKSEHVNLQECYLFLSDLCKGVAPKKLDKISYYFIDQCLIKLSKPMGKGETGLIRTHLRSMRNLKDFINSDQLRLRQYKEKYSSSINPLSIPDNLLQMSETEQNMNLFE